MKLPLLVSISALVIAGCATATGPGVTKTEVEEAKLELQVKGLHRLAEQQNRVWQIGAKLVEDWPGEGKREYPDSGLLVARVDKVARKAFEFPEKQDGIYVLAVRTGGPAEAAGIQQGDLLLALNDTPCRTPKAFSAAVKKMDPDSEVLVTIRRDAEDLELPMHVGHRQLKVSFWVHPGQSVNAWTDSRNIVVTGGLLRFIETDDELAVILGHELAHVTESHKGKRIATAALAGTIGTALGIATELVVPGLGGSVGNMTSGATQAAFSRDFEREADYRGLLHAYRAGYDVEAGVLVWERFATEIPRSMAGTLLSTHPSSPERMVRIRKIAQSLKSDGLEATIAKYEAGNTPQPAETSLP